MDIIDELYNKKELIEKQIDELKDEIEMGKILEDEDMITTQLTFRFLPCPICNTQTKTKVIPETILIRYPLFCERCRQEILVDVVKMKMVFSNTEDETAGYEGTTKKE